MTLIIPSSVPNCFPLRLHQIVQFTFRSNSQNLRRANPPQTPARVLGLPPLRRGPPSSFQSLSLTIPHQTRPVILSTQRLCRTLMARFPCTRLRTDSTFIRMRNMARLLSQFRGGRFRQAALTKHIHRRPRRHRRLCLNTLYPILLHLLKSRHLPVMMCRRQHMPRSRISIANRSLVCRPLPDRGHL